MKKTLSIAALLLAMVLLLSACGKDESKASGGIEGTWKLTDVRSPGLSQQELKQAKDAITSGQMQQVWTFKSGKATVKLKNTISTPIEYEYTLTYSIDGSKISMTEEESKDTQVFEFKISGNTLELTMNSETMIFTKQN